MLSTQQMLKSVCQEAIVIKVWEGNDCIINWINCHSLLGYICVSLLIFIKLIIFDNFCLCLGFINN